MANWYCGRNAVKRAAKINGADFDAVIDRHIEASSRQIDDATHRWFIPKTQTRYYRWPPRQTSQSYILWLDADLLSVTTLQTKAQDSSPTTITSADYFLEPVNYGPPYDRIEIDQSSTSSFEAGDTSQRSISVAGSWGYTNTTTSAGTVTSGLASSSSATTFVASNSALIDVGHTLLIETEQVFVSDVTSAALGSTLLNGALTADKSNVTVTVDSGHGLNVGEVIKVGSEDMYISSIATNDLTVIRAYNGTVLAAHNDDTAVHVYRTYTIQRGVNGTTAATHANSTAINRYVPPKDIEDWCLAETIAAFHQEQSGWGREIGAGDNTQEFTGKGLKDIRERTKAAYRTMRTGAI